MQHGGHTCGVRGKRKRETWNTSDTARQKVTGTKKPESEASAGRENKLEANQGIWAAGS